MSGLTRPRGPLPARVYWTRRLLVLFTAFVLVFSLGRFLSRSSDGESRDAVAQQAAHQTSARSTGPATGPTSGRTPGTAATGPSDRQPHQRRPTKAPKPELPDPSGPCTASDVVVTPEVSRAEAGGDVRIKLRMHTRFAVACTWVVSPRTVTLKITSGSDDIWSSQDCRAAVTRRDVVLRAATTRTVSVVWDGRRSNPGCAGPRYWAFPGYYHVAASALAGEPADVQFQLSRPRPPVITESPSPSTKPRQDQPTPSGAVEPNG